MSRVYPLITLALIACTEAPLPSQSIARMKQASCANGDGVPSAMAALAVATATELGRWEPTVDFHVRQGLLTLTPAAQRRCADGRCWNTQALFDLQHAPAGEITIGGTSFDGASFRHALETNYEQQLRCDAQREHPGSARCGTERHALTLDSVSPGACDTVFTFDATTPSGAPLKEPERLASKLIFAGYPENEYLGFTSTPTSVSIDPTYGLNPSGDDSTGSCSAACTKISASDVSGQCCSCNGVFSSYVRSSFSAMAYVCW